MFGKETLTGSFTDRLVDNSIIGVKQDFWFFVIASLYLVSPNFVESS